MRSRDILIANPHFVPCPNGQHDPITDMYAELLEPADRVATATGRAAMVCPFCGTKMYWPRTFRNDPAPDDMPVAHWSRAQWNSWPPDKQQEAIDRILNITSLLQ
jgi:hypothetical protein